MTYKEHEINQQNNFIGGWYISPDLCDALVNRASKIPGFFRWPIDDYYVCNYLDQINSNLYDEYINELSNVCKLYTEKYKFSAEWAKMRLSSLNDIDSTAKKIPLLKFQKYYPNKSYYRYHCELDSIGNGIESKRHLATMTYLNDVEDGGGTEFYHQNYTCKPQKGLTLIWPAQWTHAHKGIPAPTEFKYIITGWYVFDSDIDEHDFVKGY